MLRSSRYDRALFWVQVAGVVLVMGTAFVVLGANQVGSTPKVTLWNNGWFVAGVCVMGLGVLALWWAITLYVAHRHAEGHMYPDPEPHKLPGTAMALAAGVGPELLFLLRQLRSDLKDSIPKMQRSLEDGNKFWAAGTEGDLQVKGWRKIRSQLQAMSGMNPLWDYLEDGFGQLNGINKLRADRVFKSYRLLPGDTEKLGIAIASAQQAIQQLDHKIDVLDGQTDPAPTVPAQPQGLVGRLKELRSFADIVRERIPPFGQSALPVEVEKDLDDWIASVSAALESKPELKRQFDSAGDSNQVLNALSVSPASQRLQNRTAILDQIIKHLSETKG